MGKITRVRTGCWTCKKRKCDEGRPSCKNCLNTRRICEGYGIRLAFDVDDRRNDSRRDEHGQLKKGFVGKPKISNASEPIPSDHVQSSEELNKTNPEAFVSTLPAEVSSSGFSSISYKDSNEKLEQLSFELFEDLEYLLGPPNQYEKAAEGKSPKQIYSDAVMLSSNMNDLSEGSISLEPRTETISTKNSDTYLGSLSYEEENMMLRHFFQKLLPLLDAHPNSPWPDLALKYCDFNIARSCFISLACMHMYESKKGGSEFYRKGMTHLNITMEQLLRSISSASSKTVNGNEIDLKTTQITSFTTLVLINVHILFAVLENGKSPIARFFFKVFSSICQEKGFYQNIIEGNGKRRSLVVVLSWYDTVSAIVSPDCRLPYCSPEWYGSNEDVVSTLEMMGCPGEIFRSMSKVCLMRHENYNNMRKDRSQILSEYETIKLELISYRDYVRVKEDLQDYAINLKGAQCWALAVHIILVKIVQPSSYRTLIRKLVLEFISVYGSMDPLSPIVTQMVWPIYAVGCECKSASERDALSKYMETLYKNVRMGTLFSLKEIVKNIWTSNLSSEEYLARWLEDGVDYLPL